MSDRDASSGISRRTALRTAAGLAGGAVGAAGAGQVAAQSAGPDFGGWFDNVSNFDGVVDKTGQKQVTVEVGVKGNTGHLAFGPPAIRIDPGTTVVWKWTGKGGGHNVVAKDGSFDSGSLVSTAGHTFKHTFENDGIYKYYCEPHRMLGMKGAVVVGDEYPSTGGGGGGTQRTRPPGVTPGLAAFTGTLFVLFASPILYHAYLDRKYPEGVPARPEDHERERTPAVEAPADDEGQVEQLGHDEFEPFGTLSLVLVYMLILVVMWVFMYFVEFLGNGPTVIG